jgi:putative oxygen-independent coproporphyrinogen III oxidase
VQDKDFVYSQASLYDTACARNQSYIYLLFMIPISLYLHFPWCIKKCPYCDFNSHVHDGSIPQQQYFQALTADFERSIPLLHGRALTSIFIGGGTPSLMDPKYLADFINYIRKFCAPNIEITLEANPGSFESAKFKDFLNAGINRLSIGVQSFNDAHLKKIGRIHDSTQAITALETAKKIGFTNINLDLMYALPEQTLEQAQTDLSLAIALQSSHLSYYQLTLEPNTYFHRYRPPLPNHDLCWRMEQQGQELLAQARLHQYEISAYAHIPCLHNINYWQFGDYLGVGAGAHGKITHDKQIIRTIKSKQPNAYMKDTANNILHPPKILSDTDIIFEFMLNNLRLSQGFTLDLFKQRTLLPISAITQKIEEAIAQKLLNQVDNHITTTTLGKRFLNDLQLMFL